MLAQGHTRRVGIPLSLSSNRIVMAWVHGLSCIIYIRKESNILDADNLTHRLERERERKKRISVQAHVSAVMWVTWISRLYVRFHIPSQKGRYDLTREPLQWHLCMSRCCSVFRTAPLQLTHTCCSSVHIQQCTAHKSIRTNPSAGSGLN